MCTCFAAFRTLSYKIVAIVESCRWVAEFVQETERRLRASHAERGAEICAENDAFELWPSRMRVFECV